MDGDNKGVPHSDLEPDQAVSLRHAVRPATQLHGNSQSTTDHGSLPAPQTAMQHTSPPAPVATPLPSQPTENQNQQSPSAQPPNATQSFAEAPQVNATALVADQPLSQTVDGVYREPANTEASWIAPEFVAHNKSAQWFAIFAGVAAVIVALTYVISRDFIAVTAVVLCLGMFVVAAVRPPRQLRYSITTTGITIGTRTYPFKDFRSFAVEPENIITSIDLVPMKRFAPMLNITYVPQHDPYIPDVLSQHLPLSQHKRTAIDELMQLVRF